MNQRLARSVFVLAPLFFTAFVGEANAQTPAATPAPTPGPQTARGFLAVLGLRAPHGDDEAASNMTSALRRAATSAGFMVPTDSPALEQSIALHEVCTDQPQPPCLTAIARQIGANGRILYGTIRRATRSSDAELRIQIRMFDVASSTISDQQEASVSGMQGRDQDILIPIARRMVDQLAPAPAAPPPPPPPPPPPNTQVVAPPNEYVPIRRYIGFGAIGLGGAMLVGGVISGVVWLGFNAEQQLTTSAWSMYQPYPQDDRRSTDGAAICDAAQRSEPNRFGTGTVDLQRPELLRVCATHGSLQGAQWGLIAAGAAVAAAGVVLVVTDRPPPRNNPAPAAGSAGPITRRPEPLRWNLSPVIASQTQGAAFSLRW